MNRLDADARALIDIAKHDDLPPPGAKVLTWERIASRLVFAPDPEIASAHKSRG